MDKSELLELAKLLSRYHDEVMIKARLATSYHAIDYYCKRLNIIQRAENDVITTIEVQTGSTLSTNKD